MSYKKEKVEEKKEASKGDPKGWYKGYDIKWLKKTTEHPDHYLVAEYEKIHGEIK